MATASASTSAGYPNWVLDHRGTGAATLFGCGSHSYSTADIVKLAADGMKVMRLDLDWTAVEQALGVYSWASGNPALLDAAVAQCVTSGVTPLIVLKWGPTTTSTGNALYTGDIRAGTGTQASQFALFCQAAAKHYISSVVYFEIGNEFDTTTMAGGTYAGVMNAVNAVIKDVTNGNPNCKVVGGVCSGMSPGNGAGFYNQCGLGSTTMDVYSAHTYTGTRTGDAYGGNVKAGRVSTLTDCGLPNLPIIVSEYGWVDTDTNALPSEVAVSVMRLCCMPNTTMISVYNALDDGTGSLSWGLYSGGSVNGGTIKTRGQAYLNAIAHAHWATSYRSSYFVPLVEAGTTFSTVKYRCSILGDGTTERGAFWSPQGVYADTINVGIVNKGTTSGTLTVTELSGNTVTKTATLAPGTNTIPLSLLATPQVLTANVTIQFIPFAKI